MATVSGSLLYDNARTNSATGLPGIENTPIVLEDVDSGLRLAVLTAANGSYTFTNVPNGNYQIVEAYGDPGPISSTGNFGVEAAVGPAAIAVTPPISVIANPPAGATNLDCITRNTIDVTVAGSDSTGLNILNGPVRYTPMVVDSSVSIDWKYNLIRAASDGTFGLFPAGTAEMTGADPNPYPGVNPGFTYVLPIANTPNPSDGYFTIQNIANNISYQVNGSWWRIADRTTGNETGRMMIVNGYNPGSVFFEDNVTVVPNTYYLFATSILNLIRVSGRASPELGVTIKAPDGTVLYDKDLGVVIPVNFDQPEWFEDGTIINSGDYTSLDVKFLSYGEAASGNDYAIDNVGFYEAGITLAEFTKSSSKTTARVGELIDFSVSFRNDAASTITGISFSDPMPDGLVFVQGSVTINGTSCLECDPGVGFDLPDLGAGASMVVTFEAIVDYVPSSGIASNIAFMTYDIVLVERSNPITFELQSNQVDITLVRTADIYVQKIGPDIVENGATITYDIIVGNNGPDSAYNIIVSDVVPPKVTLAKYSIDSGVSWHAWEGSYVIGSMTPGQIKNVLIRGIVASPPGVEITNAVGVLSDAFDPDMNNNTSSFTSSVTSDDLSADIYVQKIGPKSVRGGGDVTYSITVGNSGPDTAADVLIFDAIALQLLSPNYSIDGGSTWHTWTGVLSLGNLGASQTVVVYIRGIAENPKKSTTLTNIVNVSSSTPDPNPDNNTSTANTTLPPNRSRDQAITDIIQSVALQEAALAHIMNAEGKKMQRIIAMDDVSAENLMVLNESVTKIVSAVLRLEMILVAKLETFAKE